MLEMRKIPVTVITGFLGAGKTSIIRGLLERANGRRLALIINEFGDLGIDGEILRGCGIGNCTDDDIVELTNGCLCCTVADDFMPTLEALLDREDRPDHIIIETSGLALPKPLIKAFQWPEVRSRTTVDGIIAVVDGPAVSAGQFASDPAAVEAQRRADQALDHDSPLEEVFEDQLACADIVLVSKSDLMDAADHGRVAERMAGELRPSVKAIAVTLGNISPELILGLGRAVEDDLDARPSHHDDVDGEHDHDDFESIVVELPPVAETAHVLTAAAAVLAMDGILRVKGVCAVNGNPARLIVQGVGARLEHYFDRPWGPIERAETRLVAIGLAGMDAVAVRAAFARATE